MSLWKSLTGWFTQDSDDTRPDPSECDHENVRRVKKHAEWDRGLTPDEERFAVVYRWWHTEYCEDCGETLTHRDSDPEESGPVLVFEPDDILETEAEYFEKYGSPDDALNR